MWVLEHEAEGKMIAIVKVSEDGRVFSEPAPCQMVDEAAVCKATFTGEAGGFSTFMLVAVQPGPAPTATLAPAPPPTSVSATPTLAPTVSEATAAPTIAASAPTATVGPLTGNEGGNRAGLVLMASVAVGAVAAVAMMAMERGGIRRG
jgi:hypothetical protein